MPAFDPQPTPPLASTTGMALPAPTVLGRKPVSIVDSYEVSLYCHDCVHRQYCSPAFGRDAPTPDAPKRVVCWCIIHCKQCVFSILHSGRLPWHLLWFIRYSRHITYGKAIPDQVSSSGIDSRRLDISTSFSGPQGGNGPGTGIT